MAVSGLVGLLACGRGCGDAAGVAAMVFLLWERGCGIVFWGLCVQVVVVLVLASFLGVGCWSALRLFHPGGVWVWSGFASVLCS